MRRMTSACFDFVTTQSRSGVDRTRISLAKCQGIAKRRKRARRLRNCSHSSRTILGRGTELAGFARLGLRNCSRSSRNTRSWGCVFQILLKRRNRRRLTSEVEGRTSIPSTRVARSGSRTIYRRLPPCSARSASQPPSSPSQRHSPSAPHSTTPRPHRHQPPRRQPTS